MFSCHFCRHIFINNIKIQATAKPDSAEVDEIKDALKEKIGEQVEEKAEEVEEKIEETQEKIEEAKEEVQDKIDDLRNKVVL